MTTETITIGDRMEVMIRIIMVVMKVVRKRPSSLGISKSMMATSVMQRLRITPDGVVSKNLMGLLSMFQLIDL